MWPGQKESWDEKDVLKAVRRRRIARVVVRGGILLILISIAADHLHWFGWRGDDWSRFDHRSFIVKSVSDPEAIVIAPAGGGEQRVHLLGVATLDGTWRQQAADDLKTRLAGRSIILKLEPTQTRDANGRLLAYAYASDSDLINVDLVADGMALADRRDVYLLHGEVEQAEAEARKKRRGIWAGDYEALMPAWRKQWAADRKAREPGAIQPAATTAP